MRAGQPRTRPLSAKEIEPLFYLFPTWLSSMIASALLCAIDHVVSRNQTFTNYRPRRESLTLRSFERNYEIQMYLYLEQIITCGHSAARGRESVERNYEIGKKKNLPLNTDFGGDQRSTFVQRNAYEVRFSSTNPVPFFSNREENSWRHESS